MINFYKKSIISKRKLIKYINLIPNNCLTCGFKVMYDGTSYAGNPKRKTNTRISILIPKDIANDNLQFMRNWNFIIIGYLL